jgi:uncharacterized phage-like protein YoqJ
MENYTVCFSGHRKLENPDSVLINTRREVINLIEHGANSFLNGMALGYDLLTARLVLDLKKVYPQIRLTAVLPCPADCQTKFWKLEQRTTYSKILEKADKVITLSPNYHRGCMQARNRYMVERSRCLVCFLTEETGGTAYTVRLARERGIRIINTAP